MIAKRAIPEEMKAKIGKYASQVKMEIQQSVDIVAHALKPSVLSFDD